MGKYKVLLIFTQTTSPISFPLFLKHLHHLLRFEELLNQAVDVLHFHAKAGGDARLLEAFRISGLRRSFNVMKPIIASGCLNSSGK